MQRGVASLRVFLSCCQLMFTNFFPVQSSTIDTRRRPILSLAAEQVDLAVVALGLDREIALDDGPRGDVQLSGQLRHPLVTHRHHAKYHARYDDRR